jgi:hypothetical protein
MFVFSSDLEKRNCVTDVCSLESENENRNIELLGGEFKLTGCYLQKSASSYMYRLWDADLVHIAKLNIKVQAYRITV